MSALYVHIQPLDRAAFWLTQILRGVEQTAAERRMAVRVVTPESVPAGEWVMLIGPSEEWLIREAGRARGCRIFPVNATIPPDIDCMASAHFSMEGAVRECVRYFASLGCRRPALVGLNPNSSADSVKRRVFREETARLGLESVDGGEEPLPMTGAIRRFFASSPCGEGADGVLCANDTVAILLMAELKRRGIVPGRAYPVIGMGNSHLGQRMTPTLTSLDFDYFALGREAARLYTYMSGLGETNAVQSVALPCRLIVRESSGGGSRPELASPAALDGGEVDYFHGEAVERILYLEEYLQRCDRLDRELIFSAGESYRTMSERLYISDRAAKYRMSHILRELRLPSKTDLAECLRLAQGG